MTTDEKAAGSDDALVRRCRDGDEEAFRVLYRRHAKAVQAFLSRRTPPNLNRRLSLADLVQETFTTAFEHLLELRGGFDGAFRRWLFGIAEFKLKEACRRHIGAARRAVNREVSRDQRPETGNFLGREPTPSARAIAVETESSIDHAMRALPPEYRRILDLVHREGYSVTAAGEVMGRSVKAASKLYARAVDRLASELAKDRD